MPRHSLNKKCVRGYVFVSSNVFSLFFSFVFFSLPCQPPGIPALTDPPVGRHLSHFMVSSFSYVLAIFLAS
jgi:hypothetical protein